MDISVRPRLTWSSLVLAALAGSWAGCAGVKMNNVTPSGSGGAGGGPPVPCIAGLQSITVTPDSQMVNLTLDQSSGKFSSAMATYQATGHMGDGSSMDVTSMVSWPTNLTTLSVAAGTAT